MVSNTYYTREADGTSTGPYRYIFHPVGILLVPDAAARAGTEERPSGCDSAPGVTDSEGSCDWISL